MLFYTALLRDHGSLALSASGMCSELCEIGNCCQEEQNGSFCLEMGYSPVQKKLKLPTCVKKCIDEKIRVYPELFWSRIAVTKL